MGAVYATTCFSCYWRDLECLTVQVLIKGKLVLWTDPVTYSTTRMHCFTCILWDLSQSSFKMLTDLQDRCVGIVEKMEIKHSVQDEVTVT